MSVSVEKMEKNCVKMTIEVAAEEFDKAMQKAYLKQKGKISVPGFRKGKVPRQLIEKMYGPEIFYEEAADTLLQQEYPKAVEESGLDVQSRPDVEITQVEKGKPFIFTAVVAVYPEVTLGEYKGIEVPIRDTEVTDEEVQKELEREQEKNSRMISLDEEPAEKDDVVTMDYEGTIGGELFDGGSAKDHELKLGSGQFIPGFEDQLIGVKAGEEKDVVVTFPEDYHSEDLRGKEANFHCVIHKVERKELPELDDDFAQDVSEFDTLDEYKESLKKGLEDQKKESAKRADENAAVIKAGENATIELSDMAIEEQARRMVNDYAQNLMSQGFSIEQYCQMLGTTVEKMIEDAKQGAETTLRTRFTLEKIAETENLEGTDEYFRERVEEMASAYNMEADKLMDIMGEEYEKQMRKDLLVNLASEFVGAHAVETQAATDAEKAKAEEEAAKIVAETAEQAADGEQSSEEE